MTIDPIHVPRSRLTAALASVVQVLAENDPELSPYAHDIRREVVAAWEAACAAAGPLPNPDAVVVGEGE